MIDPFTLDPPESLRSPRLHLRLAELEDAEDLHHVINGAAPHLADWLDWAALQYDLDEIERRVRRTRAFWAQRDSFEWLLWADHGERLIGAVDIHSIHWTLQRAELGYWLVPQAQGQGLAVEAGQAVLGWAKTLFQRIEARCDARNTRSRATLGRLGFAYEGTLRRNARDAKGLISDECIFSLLAEPTTFGF